MTLKSLIKGPFLHSVGLVESHVLIIIQSLTDVREEELMWPPEDALCHLKARCCLWSFKLQWNCVQVTSAFKTERMLLLQSLTELPVVAGLSHVCWTLAAAGRIHKMIHNDPHDRSWPLKLPAEDDIKQWMSYANFDKSRLRHIFNLKKTNCNFLSENIVLV